MMSLFSGIYTLLKWDVLPTFRRNMRLLYSGPKSRVQIHDLDPEDGDCMFLRNVGNKAHFNTVQVPKQEQHSRSL
jgi:hypothetical protein